MSTKHGWHGQEVTLIKFRFIEVEVKESWTCDRTEKCKCSVY